tara:strand:+ start:4039 stop:5277 length:1239 start_codon:yes stop_codon:yes gene_type:complete
MSNINFDLDITKYNDIELLNILELDPYISSNQEIITKIDMLKQNIDLDNQDIYNFFNDMLTRLINRDSNQDFTRLDIYTDTPLVETFENIENSRDIDESSDKLNPEETDNTDSHELIKLDRSLLESSTELIYIHFNTLYRANSNTQIPTNCEFIMPAQINNIIQTRLASVNIKKPYLISESKNNNKFKIILNKNNRDTITANIIISKGFYNTQLEISNEINLKLSQNVDVNFINFSIDKNNELSQFDISKIPNDISSVYIDFKSDYIPPYSLATILGFDYNTVLFYTTNNYIISNSCFNNFISDLFFCFDEYQSNILETHKIILDRNMLTQKVLAKVRTSDLDTANYIHEVFSSTNTRFDSVRSYSGTTNLSKFNIKIIDNFGKIVNQDIKSDVTFTLEFKILNERLKITNN